MKLFILWLCTALACFANPNLTSIHPMGGTRGQSVELNLRGSLMKDTQDLLFYREGISVERIEIISHKHVKVKLVIDPNAKLGEYPFRVRTRYGISYQRTFWVGPFPLVTEVDGKGENNTNEKAQPLNLSSNLKNVTVAGRIRNEDVDYYKINRMKGQWISAEVECMRLGVSLVDPYLAVLDRDGKPLASSDDTPLLGQDGFVSVQAPANGVYFIQIRDSSYQGADNGFYRLHVGEFTRPHVAFPIGGDLQGSGYPELYNETIKIGSWQDTERNTESSWIIVPSNRGEAPSYMPYKHSTLPSSREVEPNQSHTKPTTSPHNGKTAYAIDGVIQWPGDVDTFKVNLKKGFIRIELFAADYGSSLDGVLQLCDTTGKSIQSNDDRARGVPDPMIQYAVPKDGLYYIKVRDRLNQGSATSVYRLEISRPKPKVSASLIRARPQDSQLRKTLCIPQGGRMAYKLVLQKRDFRGQLELFAKELPSGVTMDRCVISEKRNVATFILRASAGAPIAGQLCHFELRGKDVVGPVTDVVEHAFVNNGGIFHSYTSHRLAVAVIEPSPVTLHVERPTVPIVRNGSLKLKIRIDRGEYKGKVGIILLDKPNGMGANYSVIIPEGKSEIDYTINANASAELGHHNLAVISYIGRIGELAISSDWIPVEVREPYIKMKLAMATTQQGQSVTMIGTLEGKLDQPANVRLVGLPDGIIAKPSIIEVNATTATIQIKVPANARVGKFSHLYCVADVLVNGKIVPHAIGHGGVVRVDRKSVKKAPAKKIPITKIKPATKLPPTAKTKKPLTRLEQLRQKKE